VASAIASLSATGLALHHRYRPPRPPTRVMRLLEIWLAVRTADAAELAGLEAETDAIVEAVVREEAHGRTETIEMRLVALLATHVHEALRRRAGRAVAGGPHPVP
jgi:hypothetical protein